LTQLNEELMEETNSTKSSKQVYDAEEESCNDDTISSCITDVVILVGVRGLEEVESEHCVMSKCVFSQISSVVCSRNDCDKTNLIDSAWFTKQNEIAFFGACIGVVMHLTSQLQLNIAQSIYVHLVIWIIVEEETNCITVCLVVVCVINSAN